MAENDSEDSSDDITYCPECDSIADLANSNARSLGNLYVCFNCLEKGFYFTDRDIDSPEKPYRELECPYCDIDFNTVEAKLYHIRAHTIPRSEESHTTTLREIKKQEGINENQVNNLIEERWK